MSPELQAEVLQTNILVRHALAKCGGPGWVLVEGEEPVLHATAPTVLDGPERRRAWLPASVSEIVRQAAVVARVDSGDIAFREGGTTAASVWQSGTGRNWNSVTTASDPAGYRAAIGLLQKVMIGG